MLWVMHRMLVRSIRGRFDVNNGRMMMMMIVIVSMDSDMLLFFFGGEGVERFGVPFSLFVKLHLHRLRVENLKCQMSIVQ